METIFFVTSFFGNGTRSVSKVATEAKPRTVSSKHKKIFRMKNYFYLLMIVTLSFFSCNQEQKEFNQSQWKTRDDILYNHREGMIQDLQTNYLKKGMKLNDVESLLGENQLTGTEDSLQLQYEIFVDYGFDIDPVETKFLVLNFNQDSTLINSYIHHWEK